MENEFGEEITDAKASELAEKIRALPRSVIDEIWYEAGFIISDREKGNKALRNLDIEAIKRSKEEAKEKVINLLLESHISEVEEIVAKYVKKYTKK